MNLPLAAGTYRLDPHHSQIGFTVVHLGLTPVRGLFPEFEGTVRVGDQLSDVELTASITMSSVQSGHVGRDDHLQVPDYFDSAAHPVMRFESESVEPGDGDDVWIVNGQLTVKTTTQPLRLTTVFTGQRLFPMDQQQHAGFVATGRLSRHAFGVAAEVPDEMLSDQIELDIAAQLVAE